MKKRVCNKCGSKKIEFGKFDPVRGSEILCKECGHLIIINHQEYGEFIGRTD